MRLAYTDETLGGASLGRARSEVKRERVRERRVRGIVSGGEANTGWGLILY